MKQEFMSLILWNKINIGYKYSNENTNFNEKNLNTLNVYYPKFT